MAKTKDKKKKRERQEEAPQPKGGGMKKLGRGRPLTSARNPFQDMGVVKEFELLGGEHIEVDPDTGERTIYRAKDGDTVKSSKPLDKMFANKFRLLGGKSRRPHDRSDHLDQSGRVMDRPLGTEDDEEDDVRAKRLKANRQEGVVKKKQSSPADRDFEEDEEDDDMEEMTGFRGNRQEEEEEDSEEVEGTEEGEESEFGGEVTADFEDAASADLKVFHDRKKGYTVVDADQPDRPLPKGKGLKTSKQVNKFLSNYRKK